jgi:hydroxyacylglutathione hydrolase
MRFNFMSVFGDLLSRWESDSFYPQETGPVSDNLYAIRDRDVNLFLYSDGESTLCIDAGYMNNDNLGSEFEKMGIDPASITHLFLTHTDMDHAGGIDKDSRTDWFPNAKIFMGRDEECMIARDATRMLFLLNPIEMSKAYVLLDDADLVHVGDVTVQAIATPGHTLGHMAYLINGEILCTGDALVLKDEKVAPFYRTWNMDHEKAIQSVRKIAALENVSVLCTAHTQCSRNFKDLMHPWCK